MKIKLFECNMLQENCYVVSDESSEAVIIDCGALWDNERQAILRYITENNLKVRHLLCTHGHLDHCFGAYYFYEKLGLHPEASPDDAFLIENLSQQASTMFGLMGDFPSAPVDYFTPTADGSAFKDISFGSTTLRIIPTPGHTPGGVVFYEPRERVLFSGDTLFRMSVGRTDFIRGDYNKLIASLHRLADTLPGDTRVLCGHGPETILSDEIRYNPFLGRE